MATLIVFMLLYNMFSCKTLVELLHSDMNWTTNQGTHPTNCRTKPAQINLWSLFYSNLFNVNFTTVSITLAMAKETTTDAISRWRHSDISCSLIFGLGQSVDLLIICLDS